LRPDPMPRGLIRAIVLLVKRHAGTSFEIMAQSACYLLQQSLDTFDSRPLQWALQEGLLPHMLRMTQVDLRQSDPKELLEHVHTGLAFRRVQRVFWKTYERDKKAIENAPWKPKILKKIVQRAKKNHENYEALHERWLSSMDHCNNPQCPSPKTDLLQCPCKAGYYCSKACQRAHWHEHRDNCHIWHWDAFEETDLALDYPLFNQRDIDYLKSITQSYVDLHLDDIANQARAIDPGLGHTYRLTVAWVGGEPTHRVTVADLWLGKRAVVITAALMMGNEFVLVTLSGLTLVLKGPEGCESDDEVWTTDEDTSEGEGCDEGKKDGDGERDPSKKE
ncbi:hypothetical protein HDZ31DRAFT_49740, partial [Schizophyllum fasciatum]